MGRALQSVYAFKQAITGGAFEALAAGTGDSLSVPNFAPGANADIIEAWGGNHAHACDFGIRSPSFHDNTRGIRLAYDFNPTLSGADGDPSILLPKYVTQPLYATDTLTVEVNGTALDNVGISLLEYFADLPGADQRLIGWAEMEARQRNIVGIKVAVVAGAAGDYGANRILNQDDDRLKADKDYALLGLTTQLPCNLISITGPDLSSRRVGIPGHWNAEVSAGWFADLSVKYSLPLIPVINSNNRGNTIVQAADPGGAIATGATLIFAELS